MTFDYKKYSLEKLETWVRDALTSAEATPQEVYDTIKGVVDEEYHYFKHHTGRCYDLLCLLNGNGKGHIEEYDSVMREKEYYEPSMPPWGHSDLEYMVTNPSQYTEEELNAMCDKASSDEEKEQCQEYNLREVEYCDKRDRVSPDSMSWDQAIQSGWTMTDDGFWIGKDKVKKWVLPTGVDGLTGDVIINLPDDLLESANLKEGDQIQWFDIGDGSYKMVKVTEPLKMDEC
jgi:hypothetical protein